MSGVLGLTQFYNFSFLSSFPFFFFFFVVVVVVVVVVVFASFGCCHHFGMDENSDIIIHYNGENCTFAFYFTYQFL